MEKVYKTLLVPESELKTPMDYELNIIKLEALKSEIESDILEIRFNKLSLLKKISAGVKEEQSRGKGFVGSVMALGRNAVSSINATMQSIKTKFGGK